MSVSIGFAAEGELRVPSPLTAEFLGQIKTVPFYFERDPGDPRFLAIVKLGLGVVPDLMEHLDNPSFTEPRVPLTGGNYAIGDIAMMAVSDIIRDVPWLEFITKPDDPQIEEIGFGVYWKYVRASRRNRQTLKKRAQAWYEQNRDRLRWHADPSIPSGGVYVLANEKQ